ncbi:MAG: sensor histidine kinase [Vicinamibacterales bacterium]
MTSPSLRSQLVAGSVLWTLGVMLTVSVLLLVFFATHPRPHAVALTWMLSVPLWLTFTAGLACMAGGMWRIRRSLASMDRLRTALAAIQRGDHSRVDEMLPGEVRPLVDTLNALLADREARVDRAVARAGDLAHGLKTPLAVLAADAAQVLASGDAALGASLDTQVRRMQRHIDYHLAHARAAAAAGRGDVRSDVEPAVAGLFRTLARIHADRPVTFRLANGGEHAVCCEQRDLEEMLGNLLDNACKWARRQVVVSVDAGHGHVTIAVDDDGRGIEAGLRLAVLERGVRADEGAPGTGLGLTITRDLAELYDGTLALTDSPLGGLRATLSLPARPN